MAFNPANVSNPVHQDILDSDDQAYYTDASGNKVPAMVAVVATSANALNSFQGSGVLSSSNLVTHPASNIDKLSRPPFFQTAGGQLLPIVALMGFDASNNLQPLSSAQTVSLTNFATGGSVGTAATTVDVSNFLLINQTTASQTLTLPNPTNAGLVRSLYVGNTGTNSFTLLGQVVASGAALLAIWNGTAWMYTA